MVTHSDYQRTVKKIVNKAKNSRASELHSGYVDYVGTVSYGSVTYSKVFCYLNGQGKSGTALGNSIAQAPAPVPCGYIPGQVYAPGDRVMLKKWGSDNHAAGNQYFVLGRLEDAFPTAAQQGNVEITTTSGTQMFDYTAPTAGLFQCNLYFHVTATTTVTAQSYFTDDSGSQSVVDFATMYGATGPTTLNAVSLSAGHYPCFPIIVRAGAGQQVVGQITCGTANQVYASWSITEVGSV